MTISGRSMPLAGAAMLAIAATLAAQTHSGTVQGRLIDEHGSPIAGGTVTLQGSAAPQRTSADAQGHFRFLQVPPGTYSVTAAAPGFASSRGKPSSCRSADSRRSKSRSGSWT